MTLTLEAWAKVNLYLHVVAQREDGYHELDSLIVFAQTGDQLSFEPADTLSLNVTGPMAEKLDGDPDDNLVLRAAQGLQTICQIRKGAHITLEKHLPVAAGIGGGSGDAATALKGLCQLWEVFPDPARLEKLALELGADVPICLKSHAAHVGGVGEIITGIPPLPDCWMVLINPMCSVETPAVFRARTGPFSPAQPMTGEYDFSTFINELSQRQNDLMTPALSIAPQISTVLKSLSAQKACALSRMSGSGATCFGLFERQQDALAALENLQLTHPKWWISCGKLI